MSYKLDWKKSSSEKNTYIGICEDLPDSYCNFQIKILHPDLFQAIPPTLILESNESKILLRDKETAKDFCEDFINYNTVEIVRRQIQHMKGSSIKPEKPVRYYEDILQWLIESDRKSVKVLNRKV